VDENQTSCLKSAQINQFLDFLALSPTMLSTIKNKLKQRIQNMTTDNTLTYSECFDVFHGVLDYSQNEGFGSLEEESISVF